MPDNENVQELLNLLDENGTLYLWQRLKLKFANKVDVVPGKGLSTNDLTNELVAKINNAATQQDIADAITALVNASPAALDTLKELADALGNDPNFATTMATQLGSKLDASAITIMTNADIDAILAT